MSGVNKVILIGNLGRDPEYRHMEGGIMVAKFPLATTETYRGKDGQRAEQTEWHNVVLWRGLAEAAEKLQLRKGHTVYIEGKIRSRTWEKDGVKRFSTDIVADNMTMLSKRDSHASSGQESQPSQEAPPPTNDLGGELPF